MLNGLLNDAKDLETYGLKDETPADVTFEKVDAKTKAATSDSSALAWLC